ncbi:MAG: hypothetical protein KDC53_18190 [Saprospiraceae bacterium]|nr:hypothetical protein [Saprospiraceae bacterium]
MIKRYFTLIFFIGLLACNQKEPAPDVSNIEITSKLVRFEQELFESDTQNLQSVIETLTSKYPEFSDIFFNRILADPSTSTNVTETTRYFVRDSFIQALYQDCKQQYGDFSPLFDELKQGLRYFKYYFPDKPIPDIYTCITGFEYGSFTVGDNILAIGLDFYLGANYQNYHPDLFPVYITSTMDRDHLVAKTIQTLITNYWGETRGNKLIDYMVHNGMILYVKKKLLPEVSDEIIFEYSSEQLAWLKANESQIWAYLIEENQLLSTEYRSFQKIISPSPSVPGMPPEAPGRLGNWIGERMVERYMERNPQTPLTALIQLDDGQKIMAESKYKPRQ